MKKYILLFLLTFVSVSFAKDRHVDTLFSNKQWCFMLYDINHKQVVSVRNKAVCHQRIPADSTFKLPLSLMAFDQNIISQQTVFKWDKKEKGRKQWDQDQTPQSWLHDSVVWVSQGLTPKLGLDRINVYLARFHYGNEDFTGDPGKRNGLTHAWLSSSLKIAPSEQLHFLNRLITYRLAISHDAVLYTVKNMNLNQRVNGTYALYGKTGSGRDKNNRRQGWFVGYLIHGTQKYSFVADFVDTQHATKQLESGGLVAKNIALNMLNTMSL